MFWCVLVGWAGSNGRNSYYEFLYSITHTGRQLGSVFRCSFNGICRVTIAPSGKTIDWLLFALIIYAWRQVLLAATQVLISDKTRSRPSFSTTSSKSLLASSWSSSSRSLGWGLSQWNFRPKTSKGVLPQGKAQVVIVLIVRASSGSNSTIERSLEPIIELLIAFWMSSWLSQLSLESEGGTDGLELYEYQVV